MESTSPEVAGSVSASETHRVAEENNTLGYFTSEHFMDRNWKATTQTVGYNPLCSIYDRGGFLNWPVPPDEALQKCILVPVGSFTLHFFHSRAIANNRKNRMPETMTECKIWLYTEDEVYKKKKMVAVLHR